MSIFARRRSVPTSRTPSGGTSRAAGIPLAPAGQPRKLAISVEQVAGLRAGRPTHRVDASTWFGTGPPRHQIVEGPRHDRMASVGCAVLGGCVRPARREVEVGAVPSISGYRARHLAVDDAVGRWAGTPRDA